MSWNFEYFLCILMQFHRPGSIQKPGIIQAFFKCSTCLKNTNIQHLCLSPLPSIVWQQRHVTQPPNSTQVTPYRTPWISMGPRRDLSGLPVAVPKGPPMHFYTLLHPRRTPPLPPRPCWLKGTGWRSGVVCLCVCVCVCVGGGE